MLNVFIENLLSFQGLLIFVFHCVRNTEVRYLLIIPSNYQFISQTSQEIHRKVSFLISFSTITPGPGCSKPD